VGVLDRFEKGIERAVNSAFAKAFRSEVQPVEIASALRRESDDKAAVVGRNRTISPNAFVVELGPADHERLGEWEEALGDELRTVVHDHARQQRYAFVGPVRVSFEMADDLDTGVFRVRSATVRTGEQHDAGRRDDRPRDPRRSADPYGADPYGADPYGADAQGGDGSGADPYDGDPYDVEQHDQRYRDDRHADRYGRAAGYPAAGAAAGYGAPALPPPGPADPRIADPRLADPRYRDPRYADPRRAAGPPSGALPVGAAPPQASVPAWSGQASSAVPSLEVDGHAHRLTKPVVVLGRATDADIVLDDPGVSRRHAEVHVRDGHARVVDLGSTNGTYVDGERVRTGTLAEGSTITMGRTRLVFHSGQW
jgi:hypothetical protein